MNSSRKMYERVFAIFGTVMVVFYFGLALFILTSDLLDHIDKALRIVISIPLFIYALYRVFTSYEKIKESFFTGDDE